MDGTQRSRLGALAVVGVLLAALAGAGLVNASPARKHSVGPTERVRAVLLSPGKHVRGPAHRRAIPRRTKNPAAERAAKQRHAREPAPRQAPSAAPNTTVFSSLNAPGLSASDNTAANQGTPPDTTGAIGPSHYVEFVNSKVRVYTRASLSTVSTADLDTFVGKSGQDVFDPQIQFDPQSNRWFYVSGDCTTSNCSRNNSLVFGWSKTSDPSDLVNGWCRYSISTGKKFDDFPKLGHDDNHILIGANVYSPTIFSNGQVWSVPTPGAGTTCPTSVTASGFNLTSAAFTPVPANTADSSTNGYIVAADYPGSGSASHIAAWHVSGSGASPVLTSDGSMTVTSFATPANVPQPGTSNVLDSSDTRLTNAVAHTDPDAGGAEAVWTQHTVAGSGAASVVRWYELLPASATVRQSGTIAAGSNYAFNGAISPGSDGTSAVLDYNVGGSSQLVQIRAQSRQSGTPVGTMGGELTLGTSSAIDQDFSCSPCRWGDYAGASPDPSNGAVVWGSNQLNGPTSGTAAAWTTRNFALSAASGGSAPSVTTGSATSITQSSATLNGTVNPNGQATTYHFDYGTSTSYGSKAPPGSDPSAGSGTSDQAVSANLTGLTPGTTYHYRLVATNASGTTQGQDKTFTSSGSGYSQTILNTPGLVSYWRLGETSGSTAADAKGSDNGTYEGGVALGQPGALAGDPDTSVGFDGNTGTDMAAGVPAGMGAANASVEAWAYMPASTAKGAFTMVGNGLNGYGFGVGSGTFDNSGSHLVVLFESVRWIDTGATLTQGWHHVVLTLGGGGSPTVYLDGAQVYTDTGSPPLAPTGSVHVGGYTAAGPVARYFNGRVDEVALYTAALTPTQVSNHYTIGTGSGGCAPRTSTYSNAVLGTSGVSAYWRLGESSGITACDSQGSDNGTYEGGVALGQPGALAGDPDTSVGFDGNTGTDMAAGVPAGMGAANASVEAWAYMPASTAKGAFTMVGNGLNGYGFGVGSGTFDNSGSHLVVLFESVRWIDTGATLTQGWHHVVLTLGGGGSPTVYLDGAQVYTDTGSPPLAPTGSVHVGGYTAAGPVARYFNGRVDEVALYTAALTPTQVSNHYTIGTGG